VYICIIAPPWAPVPPVSYGGTEAVIDTLARGLTTAGHDVLLVATGDSSCPAPSTFFHETAVGIGSGGSIAEVQQVVHGYHEAAAEGVDVIHDHTLVGPLFSRHAVGRRPPVVATNHGPFTDPSLGPLFRMISRSAAVVAISHHHASTAVDIPIAAVIHHGVDLDRIPVGAGSGGYAACVGRMDPSKGIDAAARVARAAGMPLRIAAKMREPHEVDYFEAKVQSLLGGDIEYVGELDASERNELVGDACCLLNPIGWPEPFGMVMVEALAAGTPVVARPQGAASEIVSHGNTGFLADDEAGLAQLLGQVERLDRAACRSAAEQRFSAMRMVNDHIELYEHVAQRREPAEAMR
jgi:glycosyltransferase involved in cell wall biosynthesis